MITPNQIEQALYTALPADLHEIVPRLAATLATMANSEPRTNPVRPPDTHGPEIARAIQSLAGKTLHLDQALLSFGQESQTGDVFVDDMAGHNLTKFTFNIYYTPPERPPAQARGTPVSGKGGQARQRRPGRRPEGAPQEGAPPVAAEEASAGAAGTRREERRLATVLRANLLGRERLVAELDPEDLAELLSSRRRAADDLVQSYGGRVLQHADAQVVAVWGAFSSREDDPEQAIRAALALREQVAGLEARQPGAAGLQIGISTGVTLVGVDSATGETAALGEPVALTALLVDAAADGQIIIAHDTYRHVRGLFAVQTGEPLTLAGRAAPIPVYRVQYAKPHQFRLEARGVEGVETRMVGREVELRQMQDAFFAVVEDGERIMISVVAEAGLGKSRLLYEFDTWVELRPEAVWYFKGRATAATRQPYALLRDLFALRFAIRDSDPAAVVREKLEQGFGAVFGGDEEGRLRANIIGRLLGFAAGDSLSSSLTGDPRQIRDRGLHDLTVYFEQLAEQGPVLIALEDLHWADEASLDAISRFVEALERARLLVVCAARPTFLQQRPQWGDPPYHRQISLYPLAKRQSRELVENILQRVEQIPSSLRDLIVESAEGNPFYVEEIVKMLIDEGAVRPADDRWTIDHERLTLSRVPSTLTEVLQARIDSLSLPEQLTLERAAVIGRVFWDAAVAQLADAAEGLARKEQYLAESVYALRSRRLVFQHERSAFDGAREYAFKHALMREVAYDKVLRRVRRQYHARAAQWLATVSEQAGRADEYARLIADHYDRAASPREAARWYRRAAQHFAAQYANAEALVALDRALALLPPAETGERFAALLVREQTLGRVGDREAQQRDIVALEELAGQLGDDGLRAAVALRRAGYANAINDYPAAAAAGAQALELAERIGAVEEQARALLLIGVALYQQARYGEAQTRLERALAIVRTTSRSDLEADVLKSLGNVAYLLNEYDGATVYYQESLAVARASGDRATESRALANLGNIAMGRARYAEAQDYYERGLAIARATGDRQREGSALMDLASVAYSQSRYDEARSYYEQGLAIARAINDRQSESTALGALGGVAALTGDYPAARAYYEQALALDRATGNRVSATGQLIALGGLASMQGDDAAARAHYEESLSIALEIQNRQLEGNALAALGGLAQMRADYALARAYYEQSLAAARATQNRHGEIGILEALGVVADAQGDFAAAHQIFEQSLATAREIGNRAGEGRIYIALGKLMQAEGDSRQSRAYYDKSLAIVRELGDKASEAIIHNNLGVIAYLQGEYAKARAEYEQGLVVSRELSNPWFESQMLANVGLTQLYTGDIAGAYDSGAESLALARRLGAQHVEAYALTLLGHCYAVRGEQEEARNAYGAARDLRVKLAQPHLATEPQAGLARVALAAGEPAEALLHVEAIMAHLAAGHSLGDTLDPFLIELTCYEVLAAAGDARAAAWLAAAHSRLQERAAKLSEDTSRSMFLNSVPHHRALVAAWEELARSGS